MTNNLREYFLVVSPVTPALAVVYFDATSDREAFQLWRFLPTRTCEMAAHIEARLPDGSGLVLKSRWLGTGGEVGTLINRRFTFPVCSEGWFV